MLGRNPEIKFVANLKELKTLLENYEVVGVKVINDVYLNVKIGDTNALKRIETPMLLINETFYVVASDFFVISEEIKINNYFLSLNEQAKKPLQITLAATGKEISNQLEDSLVKGAYRKCELELNEPICLSLGVLNCQVKEVSELTEETKSNGEKFLPIFVKEFPGAIILDNKIVIITQEMDYMEVIRSCHEFCIDLQIKGINKGISYKKTKD